MAARLSMDGDWVSTSRINAARYKNRSEELETSDPGSDWLRLAQKVDEQAQDYGS